jgi:hypothetical protein
MQTSFVLYDEAEIELPHSSQDRGTLMRSKERYAEIMSGVEKLINVRTALAGNNLLCDLTKTLLCRITLNCKN